jgi:hypothetical protein
VPSAVVGQFGGQGVWEYNNATGAWLQLTGANASRLATDPSGDVAGAFPNHGVWEFTNAGGWKQLNGVDATALTMNVDGVLVAEFPGYGVGEYLPGPGWRLLTGAHASLLGVDTNGDVAGEFPGGGVWEFRPTSGWKQLNGIDVTLLVMDAAGDIVVNFPEVSNFVTSGVVAYTPPWGAEQLLDGVQASALAIDNQGNVAAQFAGYGVSQHLSGWVPGPLWHSLTGANASLLAAADGNVAGAFAGAGVWEFDPTRGWFQLTASEALVLAMA